MKLLIALMFAYTFAAGIYAAYRLGKTAERRKVARSRRIPIDKCEHCGPGDIADAVITFAPDADCGYLVPLGALHPADFRQHYWREVHRRDLPKSPTKVRWMNTEPIGLTA